MGRTAKHLTVFFLVSISVLAKGQEVDVYELHGKI